MASLSHRPYGQVTVDSLEKPYVISIDKLAHKERSPSDIATRMITENSSVHKLNTLNTLSATK